MVTLKVPVTAEDHVQGDKNAMITLIEYGDYECPFCALVHPVVKQLQQHFGKQLKFVFRNFPLAEAHPAAFIAAETAEFAGNHQRYWEMHDLIYENQKNLNPSSLFGLVETLRLPSSEYEKVIREKTYESKIKNDFLGGVRSGVNGTPTFFINDQRYNGPFDYHNLVSAIEAVAMG